MRQPYPTALHSASANHVPLQLRLPFLEFAQVAGILWHPCNHCHFPNRLNQLRCSNCRESLRDVWASLMQHTGQILSETYRSDT